MMKSLKCTLEGLGFKVVHYEGYSVQQSALRSSKTQCTAKGVGSSALSRVEGGGIAHYEGRRVLFET